MDRRNEEIKPGTVYYVQRPSGKYFRVYSKEQIDRMVDRGDITDEDFVGFMVSNSF